MSSRESVRLLQPLRAARIVAERSALPDAAEIEARVRAAYQKGFDEASVHINQQILEQRNEVNHLRDRVFRSLDENTAAAVADLRAALPVLTMQALRRVLARVEIGRETVAAIVDEMLVEIGPDVGPIEVRLHPEDLRLVQDLEPQLARIHPGLRFVADEALQRGDSQAVTRFGKVDARLENKLEKIEASIVNPS